MILETLLQVFSSFPLRGEPRCYSVKIGKRGRFWETAPPLNSPTRCRRASRCTAKLYCFKLSGLCALMRYTQGATSVQAYFNLLRIKGLTCSCGVYPVCRGNEVFHPIGVLGGLTQSVGLRDENSRH